MSWRLHGGPEERVALRQAIVKMGRRKIEGRGMNMILNSEKLLSKFVSKIGMGAFNTLGIVIFILNLFGGIIAGIWLLSRGEVRVVVVGFIVSLIMPNFWWIIFLPVIGFLALRGSYKPNGNNTRFLIYSFINLLYQSFTNTVWVVLIFVYIVYIEGAVSKGTPIPLAIWGYSVATSPIIFMASYETLDNIAAYAMVFLSETGYILLVILYFCGVPFVYSLGVLTTVLLIANTFLFLVLWRFVIRPADVEATESLSEEWSDADELP